MSRRHDAKVLARQNELLAELQEMSEAVNTDEDLALLATAAYIQQDKAKEVCNGRDHEHKLPEGFATIAEAVYAARRRVDGRKLLAKTQETSTVGATLTAFDAAKELRWESYQAFREAEGIEYEVLVERLERQLQELLSELWHRCCDGENNEAFETLRCYVATQYGRRRQEIDDCRVVVGITNDAWNEQVVRYCEDPNIGDFIAESMPASRVLLRAAAVLEADTADLTTVMLLLAHCKQEEYREAVGSLRQRLAVLAVQLRERDGIEFE